jgi:hypothetical protein
MKKDSIKPNLLILLVIHSSRAQGAADKAFSSHLPLQASYVLLRTAGATKFYNLSLPSSIFYSYILLH